MGKLFAAVGAFLGSIIALSSTGACWSVWLDEAETPESLIK